MCGACISAAARGGDPRPAGALGHSMDACIVGHSRSFLAHVGCSWHEGCTHRLPKAHPHQAADRDANPSAANSCRHSSTARAHQGAGERWCGKNLEGRRRWRSRGGAGARPGRGRAGARPRRSGLVRRREGARLEPGSAAGGSIRSSKPAVDRAETRRCTRGQWPRREGRRSQPPADQPTSLSVYFLSELALQPMPALSSSCSAVRLLGGMIVPRAAQKVFDEMSGIVEEEKLRLLRPFSLCHVIADSGPCLSVFLLKRVQPTV